MKLMKEWMIIEMQLEGQQSRAETEIKIELLFVSFSKLLFVF
jgi:hypothetical protein